MPGDVSESQKQSSDEAKRLDIYNYFLEYNYRAYSGLFCKGIFEKGVKMRRAIWNLFIPLFIVINACGCLPLMLGGAAGALGAHAISKDTIQGETDKSYDSVWNTALIVSKIRGAIKQEDYTRGYIELDADSSKVWIRVIRLTRATVRLRISSRKYHLPNLALAQDVFIKIMEEAK